MKTNAPVGCSSEPVRRPESGERSPRNRIPGVSLQSLFSFANE
jgi:hypothetical protein